LRSFFFLFLIFIFFYGEDAMKIIVEKEFARR